MATKNIGYPNGDPRNATGRYRHGGYGPAIALRPEAAGALEDLNREYMSVFGQPIRVNEGMRSYAEQVRLRQLYLAGIGNLAAVPGSSIHGWGLAIDCDPPLSSAGTVQHNWLLANAPRYGWWNAGAYFSQYEPWHWEYDGRNLSPTQVALYAAGAGGIVMERDILAALSDGEQRRLLENTDLIRTRMDQIQPAIGRLDQARWAAERDPRLDRIASAMDTTLGALARLDAHRWKEEQQEPVRDAVRGVLQRAGLANADALADKIASRVVSVTAPSPAVSALAEAASDTPIGDAVAAGLEG